MSASISFEAHSMIIQKRLRSYNKTLETSLHRLSSGSRINAAKDDPFRNYESGRIESEISSKDQARRNALDGAALLQIADGTCGEVQNILQRVRELSVQAANDTLSSTERFHLNTEAEALLKEVDRITAATTYNTKIIFGNKANSTMQTIKELSVQAANNTMTSTERHYLNEEAAKMLSGIDKQADFFSDEKRSVLDWNPFAREREEYGMEWQTDSRGNTTLAYTSPEVRAGVLHINSGATKVDEVKVSLPEVSAKGLGLDTLSLTYQNGATKAIDDLDAAIEAVNTIRTYMGIVTNHMDKQADDLSDLNIGLSDYIGKIKDTDFAEESTTFTMAQIQQQAATSILAQSNSRMSRVLEMLAR